MRAALFTLGALLAFAGCDGATRDPGLGAKLRVVNGQFYSGAVPQASGGPDVSQVAATRTFVQRGSGTNISGLTPLNTGGLIAAARNDIGYWVFSPSVRDSVETDQLDFGATFVLAATLPTDQPFDIDLYGVDADGKVGAPRTLTLTPTSPPAPDGTLVISLDWDQQADLDLHVVDPNGFEIWARKINSATPPPPPTLPPPDNYKSGGTLDFDSNSQCVIDGRRQENVYWTVPPPSGVYFVRVDTFSMCSQFVANWHLRVILGGQVLSETSGIARDSDTRNAHGAGAGVLATYFEVPGM